MYGVTIVTYNSHDGCYYYCIDHRVVSKKQVQNMSRWHNLSYASIENNDEEFDRFHEEFERGVLSLPGMTSGTRLPEITRDMCVENYIDIFTYHIRYPQAYPILRIADRHGAYSPLYYCISPRDVPPSTLALVNNRCPSEEPMDAIFQKAVCAIMSIVARLGPALPGPPRDGADRCSSIYTLFTSL